MVAGEQGSGFWWQGRSKGRAVSSEHISLALQLHRSWHVEPNSKENTESGNQKEFASLAEQKGTGARERERERARERERELSGGWGLPILLAPEQSKERERER